MSRVLQALPLVMYLAGCGEVANADKRADAGTTSKDAAVRAKEAAASLDARTEVGADAFTDAGTDADGGPCPTLQPTVGRPCTTSLACEYGSDPSIDCDTVMYCDGGVWEIAYVPFDAGCGKTNSATCPATFSDMTEHAACTGNVECYYPEARCWCVPAACPGLGCPAPNAWRCDISVWPDAGCPDPRPRLGTPCSAGELELLCKYDDVACQFLLCRAGAWQLAILGCGK